MLNGLISFMWTSPLSGKGKFSIPFILTPAHQIAVRAILNETDTLNLMFHTAFSGIALTEAASQKLRSIHYDDRKDTVQSWGSTGQTARVSTQHSIRMGDYVKGDLRILEDQLSGEQTDGKFGPDFFAGYTICVDFDRKVMEIIPPGEKPGNDFQKLPIEQEDDLLFVQATSTVGDSSLTHRFLLHTGYNGTLLYDDAFTQQHELGKHLTVTHEQSLRDAYGNVIKTRQAILPYFQWVKSIMHDLPVGFFEAKINRQDVSVIGAEILYRYHFIISADRKFIYLKENQYFSQPFEKKK